jgi:hypothetical protein
MSGHSARDQLASRLRTVWPDPIPIDVTRLPRQKGGRSEEYLVLPAMSRPVLLVPAGQAAAATALARSDDGQRAPTLSRALEVAHRHGLLRRLPGVTRVSVPDATGLVSIVRRLVPEADTVVVRLGRRRHGRAVVLQALDSDGRTLAFAKCRRGAGSARLAGERDTLHELADRPVPGITPPPVLGWAVEDDAAVLCLGALMPVAPPAAAGVPVAAMHALAGRRGTEAAQPFAETPLARRLTKEAEALPAKTPDADWILAALRRLLDTYGAEPVTTASWHGDWVPWNMTRDGVEVLLWDWEHHEDDVLPGFDHLHYLAQTRRLRDGTDAAAEDAWLADAHEALESDWKLTAAQRELTIAAYLIAVNLRFVGERVDDPAGPTHRQGWAGPMVERLAGGRQ